MYTLIYICIYICMYVSTYARMQGHEAWKAETQSKHYDFELIEDLIAKMQSLREQRWDHF
jgi:hypothetical protein